VQEHYLPTKTRNQVYNRYKHLTLPSTAWNPVKVPPPPPPRLPTCAASFLSLSLHRVCAHDANLFLSSHRLMNSVTHLRTCVRRCGQVGSGWTRQLNLAERSNCWCETASPCTATNGSASPATFCRTAHLPGCRSFGTLAIRLHPPPPFLHHRYRPPLLGWASSVSFTPNFVRVAAGRKDPGGAALVCCPMGLAPSVCPPSASCGDDEEEEDDEEGPDIENSAAHALAPPPRPPLSRSSSAAIEGRRWPPYDAKRRRVETQRTAAAPSHGVNVERFDQVELSDSDSSEDESGVEETGKGRRQLGTLRAPRRCAHSDPPSSASPTSSRPRTEHMSAPEQDTSAAKSLCSSTPLATSALGSSTALPADVHCPPPPLSCDPHPNFWLIDAITVCVCVTDADI
jgi:hypothetical protein